MKKDCCVQKEIIKNKLNVKESEYMPLIKETSVENNIDENENILKTKRRGRKPKLSNWNL